MKKKLLPVIVFGLLLFGCQKARVAPEERAVKETKLIMGTTVGITVRGEDEAESREAIKQAFREVERIDGLMSTFKENSEISLVNREGARKPVKVSEDTFQVIRESIRLSEVSDGAFDITVKPLVNLWRSARKNKRLPSEQELKKVLALVNYRNILLDENKGTIRLQKAGMEIDLGGIAKGYAVDKAVKALGSRGIKRAIVNAGGDLYLLGHLPDKDFWDIGLQHPRRKGEVLGIIKARDEAVATSGNYENYFTLREKRYGHILDPRTGKPAENGMLSVTVLTKDAEKADGLATAIFVLGREKGLELAHRLEGVEAIIISGDDKGGMVISATEGLKGKLILNRLKSKITYRSM